MLCTEASCYRVQQCHFSVCYYKHLLPRNSRGQGTEPKQAGSSWVVPQSSTQAPKTGKGTKDTASEVGEEATKHPRHSTLEHPSGFSDTR